MRLRCLLTCVVLLFAFLGCGLSAPAGEVETIAARDTPVAARNVVLVIGDGMGFEHVRAASYLQEGRADALSFHDLPYTAEVETASASLLVTDSAAAATAMATGVKVYNGVISVARPGAGAALGTVLEHHMAAGKAAGLVTTASITHATPAAFAAHTEDRGNLNEIATDYFRETKPELLFGGGGKGVSRDFAESEGYRVVTTAAELDALSVTATQTISGQFGEGHMPYQADGRGELPGLLTMTQRAIDRLSLDSDGFFLMVEAARIDHASHNNDLERAVTETLELADTVSWLYEWARETGDTLLVVTADHETGGLTVEGSQGAGQLPEVTWSTTGHTKANVPLFAYGGDAFGVEGVIDNTDLYWLLR